MAHSDGIRVVRYRSFEEICFNLRTYHHHEPTESELRNIRRLAGTEEYVLFRGNATDHPDLPDAADCGLPVFLAVNRTGAVCAHLCEID